MKRLILTIVSSFLLGSTVGAMAAGGEDLSGTSWRLVQIQSMDDSVDVPGDASKYKLEFKADGTAALQADCNRGAGLWASEAESKLRFGPIASTRAICPLGSLSDKYLAQFEWVRSYIMKDGHLFLATMADGSIIEFEPGPNAKVAATVLGEDLLGTDAAELQDTILTRLFDQFAADRGIKAEPTEIKAFLDELHRGKAEAGLTAGDELTPGEAAEVATRESTMAAGMVRQWKINKALYDQFGGRIIYQQLGPEPLDAYRQFLEERQRAGAFVIDDPAMSEAFWNYFTTDSIHDFIAPGSAAAARAFTQAPWENKP